MFFGCSNVKCGHQIRILGISFLFRVLEQHLAILDNRIENCSYINFWRRNWKIIEHTSNLIYLSVIYGKRGYIIWNNICKTLSLIETIFHKGLPIKLNIFPVENACKRCCRSTINETCSPIDGADILADGSPCIQGFCNNVTKIISPSLYMVYNGLNSRAIAKKLSKTWWKDFGTSSKTST